MEQNQSGVCQQRLLAGGGRCHKQSLSAVFTTFSWRVHISNSNTGSGVSRATGGQPSAGPEAVRSSSNRLPSAATGGSASSLLTVCLWPAAGAHLLGWTLNCSGTSLEWTLGTPESWFRSVAPAARQQLVYPVIQAVYDLLPRQD